jgi:hypothetical protein
MDQPKRKRTRLHARVEKLELELSILNGLRSSDEPIQPLFGGRAVALVVDVNSMGSARRLSIDEHPKSYGLPSRCRSHDEMKTAVGAASPRMQPRVITTTAETKAVSPIHFNVVVSFARR